MSSISSVGNTTDLYSLLNPLDAQDAQNSSQAGSSAPLSIAGTDTDGDDDGSAQSTSSGHGHHHNGLPSQIETAVTNALQNAATGTDPNTTIQQAITSVLDPTGTQTAASTDPSDPSSSSDSTASFNQLLQANGVDPQQFQQDLTDALQSNANGTNSGNVDFATLFRNFPPGSAVDTLG